MWRDNRSDGFWTLAVGATVGVAAGLLLARGRRRPSETGGREERLAVLEDDVVGELLLDPLLSQRAIEVAALGDGLVELSGIVETEEEADRASAVAQRAAGVNTVLNRLDVRILDEKLEDTRRRFEDGDPALHETRWTGIEVGIGRRRQARETDPDRDDDKIRMLERELDVQRAEQQLSEEVDALRKESGVAPAAPSDASEPADPHGAVDGERG